METVLIADHDLGFVVWLGAALAEAGFQVLPARTARRAAQIARLFNIDLMIANPALLGTADFIESLHRRHPHVKLVAATKGPNSGTGKLVGVDGFLSKPALANEASKRRWVEQVSALAREAALVAH